jgi:UDP-GlcNAc:undecaprenyl-phosphate GlcNAc-1-phosphate transferase
MNFFIIFFTALAISIALIPIAMRLAPRIGLIDKPDPRKVHAVPIPRAGGIGIVVGALVPLVLFAPLDALVSSYVAGAAVLLGFGLWDDARELGHYVKFVGQFIAVLAVVFVGDLYVTQFPFLAAPLDPAVGKAFTVFAMIGMINATNHSDGLDGLAGGLSAISLGAITFLAYEAEGNRTLAISAAALGGIFGFLRYNTHPARVFMGDGGSQFLGFTLAFLVILLTQQRNLALSPAVVLPLLGVPIVDILAVFAQRIYWRMNWFRATKNHLHHRLLELGFHHYEAVSVIYAVQMFLVVCAVLFRYESDVLLTAIYLGTCTLMFALIYGARHRGYRAHARAAESRYTRVVETFTRYIAGRALIRTLAVAIALLLPVFSMAADSIPRDIGIGALVLAVPLFGYLFFFARANDLVARVVVFVAAAFAVYVETRFGASIGWWRGTPEIAFFVLVGVATGLAARTEPGSTFETTPTDFLVLFLVLAAGALAWLQPERLALGATVAKIAILFYAIELVYTRCPHGPRTLQLGSLATFGILALRALR